MNSQFFSLKKEEIVESSHPIQKDSPFLSKTISIANAKSVALYFDRKSKLSPTDILKITTSSKEEILISDGVFPTNPLIIDSGSVNFSLLSTSTGSWYVPEFRIIHIYSFILKLYSFILYSFHY
jgi:hypothetical protein